MNILLIILIIILLIILMILFLPITYYLKGEKYQNAVVTARVSWLFSLVKFVFKYEYPDKKLVYVSVLGIKKNVVKRKSEKDELKDKSKRKDKKPKKDKKKLNIIDFMDRKFIEKVVKTLKKTLRHIMPKKLKVEGKLGFEDPYYTGLLCGIKNIYHKEFEKLNIKVETFFDREIIEGVVFARGRIISGLIAYPALVLYLSRPHKIKKRRKSRKIKEDVKK